MKFILINFLKAMVFYSTIIMGVLTVCIDYEYMPCKNMIIWFIVLGILCSITYLICKGKTSEEIKEFTGIDFNE